MAMQALAQCFGCLVPDLVRANRLLGIAGAQVGGEIVEAKGAQHRQHEVKQRRDFVL